MQTLNTASLAAWLQEQLNAENNNPYGIKFEINDNVGAFLRAGGGREPADFTVPGVLTAGPVQYVPVQTVMMATIPYTLDFYAFQGDEPDGIVPFDFAQTKEIVDTCFTSINAATLEFDGVSALITGATSYVGDVEVENGGYNRIPLSVSFYAAVAFDGVLSNSETVTLDGFDLDLLSFTVSKEKSGAAQTITGTKDGKVINTQQARVFNGTCYLAKYTPSETGTPASAMEVLENELLDVVDQNAVHSLVYRGRTYNVVFQSVGESLQAGNIVVMSFSLAEFPTGVNGNA